LIWNVAGQALSATLSPNELLVNQGDNLIPVEVSGSVGENRRTLWVTPLSSGAQGSEDLSLLRYLDWVEENRALVHDKTQGRVGYVHIPDMQAKGFAEFHRRYLQEFFNRGGNISGLLLEKLARKRLGLNQSRWHGVAPYPTESPAGPMVALCNEYTGSDGDILCHSFKQLNLGPLIGKHTGGGGYWNLASPPLVGWQPDLPTRIFILVPWGVLAR